jgi:hypothetical protein
MGLTFHYDLKTDLKNAKDVRQLVEAIRQHALDLPFAEVEEVKEFKGAEAAFEDRQDPDRFLKITSAIVVPDGLNLYGIRPSHIIAFLTMPGEGSEPAIFGFCKYPAEATLPSGNPMATDKEGWCRSAFCKTQYASDPRCGGVENFLRCHLAVVKLLDFIQQTGLATVEVEDEGGYWTNRSVEALAKEVVRYNEIVAAAIGAFRDSFEGKMIEAPITGFPTFEHLEAKGQDRIADLRRKLKRDKEA